MKTSLVQMRMNHSFELFPFIELVIWFRLTGSVAITQNCNF